MNGIQNILIVIKKYLLGDSRIIQINETRVTDDLSKDGYDFTVYDLGAVGGEAEYRLQYLDEMIATKPEQLFLE